MKELKVHPIRNGTVIDHITPGMALTVLRILGLPRPQTTSTLTVALQVPSRKAGRKDIVKIEDRELDEGEVRRIALIAPLATINIIREFEVVRKERVQLPDKVVGIVRCPNPNCVTRHEPVLSEFRVERKGSWVRLRCLFCEREIEDVSEHLL